MVNILPKQNDDPEFIQIVSTILNNLISLSNPNDIYVVQIDHRFDSKWMCFSHKILGAVGCRPLKLRIPPFVPEKVVEESYFRNEKRKLDLKPHKPLHIHQNGTDNAQRFIQNITDSGIFLWYSGDTKLYSQASLMVYTVAKTVTNFWFVSFVNNEGWKIQQLENISRREIKSLMNTELSVSVW